MLGLGFFAGLPGYLQYGDMGAGEWSMDDPKAEVLEYLLGLWERDLRLKKIEGILTVERDIDVLEGQLESGALTETAFAEQKRR